MKEITLDKDGICEILGVTKISLKKIEKNNKLSHRLELMGYEFISKCSRGRGKKSYYTIKQFDKEREEYINICKNIIKTTSYDEFAIYFMSRINNLNYPISNFDIGGQCKLSHRTVNRFDAKLKELKILIKNGCFTTKYEYIDMDTNETLYIRTVKGVNKFKYNNQSDFGNRLLYLVEYLYPNIEYFKYSVKDEYIITSEECEFNTNIYHINESNDNVELSIKDLKTKLRSDFSNHIKLLFIENECEFCGSKENLELHHNHPKFSQLLNDTLDELGFIDKKIFNSKEVKLISNILLGKQLKSNYLTLCDKCHDKQHSVKGRRIKRVLIK